jgi:hypothetical protein
MRLRYAPAVLIILAVGASPALADRGGRPHTAVAPSGACSVSGGVVSAVGLPTDEVVNFLVTDDSGTSGWVLGFTADGTWNVSVPAASGATSYRFVSRTWGPHGSKYEVFASCA